MKIGIILRCCKMKTLFGCMMIGVFLWLCCMIEQSTSWGVGWLNVFDSSVFCVVCDDLQSGSNGLKN